MTTLKTEPSKTRICTECGNEIIGGISTTTVCSGEWVDGKYARSECDKIKRRRYKNCRVHLYRGGGRLCAYILKDWIKNICLKCNKKFNAKSKYNRICPKCQRENDKVYLKIVHMVRI